MLAAQVGGFAAPVIPQGVLWVVLGSFPAASEARTNEPITGRESAECDNQKNGRINWKANGALNCSSSDNSSLLS